MRKFHKRLCQLCHGTISRFGIRTNHHTSADFLFLRCLVMIFAVTSCYNGKQCLVYVWKYHMLSQVPPDYWTKHGGVCAWESLLNILQVYSEQQNFVNLLVQFPRIRSVFQSVLKIDYVCIKSKKLSCPLILVSLDWTVSQWLITVISCLMLIIKFSYH